MAIDNDTIKDDEFMFTQIQSMLRIREGIDVPLEMIKAAHYEYMADLYRKSHGIDMMLKKEAANDVIEYDE